MRWKNTLRIAEISIELFPGLSGAPWQTWALVMQKWRRTDIKLWRKYSLHHPTHYELMFASRLAALMTQERQKQYEDERRIFTTNRMNEYAYRVLSLGQ